MPAPKLQWVKDGTSLPGATADTLILNSVALGDGGLYAVQASNSSGTVTALRLAAGAADPGRLVNLSILTALAANETMAIGTVLVEVYEVP